MEEIPIERPENNLQRKIWEVFECPESSNLARAVAVISIVMITLSIALFIIETLPSIRNEMNPPPPILSSLTNVTHPHDVPHSSGGETTYFWIFFIIETVCVTWFCFELICRFLVAPSKFAFIKNGPNIIDVVSIIPYFLQLIGLIYQKKDSGVSGFSSTLTVLRIVRLVRVFRIFKLSRHFKVRKQIIDPINLIYSLLIGSTSAGIDISSIMERITSAHVFSIYYCDCFLLIYVFC